MTAQNITSALSQLDLSSHLVAGLLYLLAGILLNSKNGKLQFYRPLQLACYASMLTQLCAAALKIELLTPEVVSLAELIGLGIWVLALSQLLERSTGKAIKPALKVMLALIWVFSLSLNVWLESLFGLTEALQLPHFQRVLGPLLLTLAVLVLVEQLFRNSTLSHRHNIKFIGIGLVLLMSFDLYSLAYLSLFKIPAHHLTYSDGIINTLAASVFILGSLRTQPEQSISISRSMAFYSTALLLASLFLLCMSMAGYYVQLQGVPWSTALQLTLLAFTFISLSIAVSSRSIRAKVQVFVSKNFFRHKYDYRNVWLNLIQTLSNISEQEDFNRLSVKAVAQIFNCQGGALWLANDNDFYELAGCWNVDLSDDITIASTDTFIKPFLDKEWVYAPGGSGSNLSDPYLNKLPGWLNEISDAWVVAPLCIGGKLTGFFLLTKPLGESHLIWEDLDVLKNIGRQLASYITRQKSAEQLAVAKQFDTYHKLTAFIMHDLKNLIAQQALVVDNAKKHKENPAFVEDAIRTIENSVSRMNHLLQRLQSNNQSAPLRSVQLNKILLSAIRKSTDRQPIPTLRSQMDEVNVVADHEQLTMILMHIIRNAQDATAQDGFIDIIFSVKGNEVVIEIEDNGCGMDEEFLKNRLFKPFESTKSSLGMGIGAYQVREFIQNMGGQIKVTSEINIGTTVLIKLPLTTRE